MSPLDKTKDLDVIDRMPSRIFKHPQAPLGAFVVLAVAGALAFQSSSGETADLLYENTYAACLRGNVLRAETNDRLVLLETQKEVLTNFLRSAVDVRRSDSKRNGVNAEANNRAIKEFRSYIKKLEETPSLSPVQVVDCAKAIKKP